MAESVLAARAHRLFDANDTTGLIHLAEESWPAGGDDLPEGISEVCRFAYIRSREARDLVNEQLWRARAVTAAVLTRSLDTTAGMVISQFFAAIDICREGIGGESRYAAARSILEEVKRLVPMGSSSWDRLFGRLYHEKRALSFLLEATGGGEPLEGQQRSLEAAEAECSPALSLAEAAKDTRGILKVKGDRALVRYLLQGYGQGQDASAVRKEALEDTVQVQELASASGYRDVNGWASTNIDVMRRGEFAGWVPYEIL